MNLSCQFYLSNFQVKFRIASPMLIPRKLVWNTLENYFLNSLVDLNLYKIRHKSEILAVFSDWISCTLKFNMFSMLLFLQDRMEAVCLPHVNSFASGNWNSFLLSKKQFRVHLPLFFFFFCFFFLLSLQHFLYISHLTFEIQLWSQFSHLCNITVLE